MLRTVRNQILNAAHNLVEKRRPVNQGAETWDLPCYGRPDLGLVVLQELNKRWDKIPGYHLVIDSFCNLYSTCDILLAIPHAEALQIYVSSRGLCCLSL